VGSALVERLLDVSSGVDTMVVVCPLFFEYMLHIEDAQFGFRRASRMFYDSLVGTSGRGYVSVCVGVVVLRFELARAIWAQLANFY